MSAAFKFPGLFLTLASAAVFTLLAMDSIYLIFAGVFWLGALFVLFEPPFRRSRGWGQVVFIQLQCVLLGCVLFYVGSGVATIAGGM